MEECAVNVIHLLNGPHMRVLKGWMSICIDAGHFAVIARR